jgi:type II secretory pathway pseudopilin PulG
MRGAGIRRDDRGESLIELLATIVVMGIAVTAILGAVATSIHLTDVHRKQAVAGNLVRGFGETVEAGVQASPTKYLSCGSVVNYRALYPTPADFPADYSRDVTAVSYWNGTAFVSTCGTDLGVQKLSLRAWSNDNRVNETLDIIIRRPCRPSDPSCS